MLIPLFVFSGSFLQDHILFNNADLLCIKIQFLMSNDVEPESQVTLYLLYLGYGTCYSVL